MYYGGIIKRSVVPSILEYTAVFRKKWHYQSAIEKVMLMIGNLKLSWCKYYNNIGSAQLSEVETLCKFCFLCQADFPLVNRMMLYMSSIASYDSTNAHSAYTHIIQIAIEEYNGGG